MLNLQACQFFSHFFQINLIVELMNARTKKKHVDILMTSVHPENRAYLFDS